MTNSIQGELIEDIPYDTKSPSEHDIQIIDKLFVEKTTTYFNLHDVKFIVILLCITIVSNITPVNNYVNKSMLMRQNPSYCMIFKGVSISIIFWIIHKMYII